MSIRVFFGTFFFFAVLMMTYLIPVCGFNLLTLSEPEATDQYLISSWLLETGRVIVIFFRPHIANSAYPCPDSVESWTALLEVLH